MTPRTALVTGASRGIGKAVATALAEEGYEVVVTGRTVHEGDAIAPETGLPLVGSLDSTVAAIRAGGGVAHPLVVDLLNLDSLAPAVDRAVELLGGRLDLVVNNAIYTGPANLNRFADTPPEELVKRVTGNLSAQLVITQKALQHMLESGRGGTFLNVTSSAGQLTPARPVGEGGWALAYAASKAGFHRIADMLAVEYGDRGIRALNVNPGFVGTERVLAAPELAFVARHAVTPAAVAGAMLRILADPSIANGAYLQAADYFPA